MNNPWQNPLPRGEYTTQKVVVYYYSGRWIPIMFYKLSNAIALYQKAQLEGKEIYVFPTGVNPNDFCRQDVISLMTMVSQSSTNLPQHKQLDGMYNQEDTVYKQEAAIV